MNKDRWQQIEKIFYTAMELLRVEGEAFIICKSCRRGLGAGRLAIGL
jgi:hypothetical protein